jgi:hypothetical protein
MAFFVNTCHFLVTKSFFSPKIFEEKRINWHKLNFKSFKATYCLPTIEIYIVGFTHTHINTHTNTHKNAHKHTHKHTNTERERA